MLFLGKRCQHFLCPSNGPLVVTDKRILQYVFQGFTYTGKLREPLQFPGNLVDHGHVETFKGGFEFGKQAFQGLAVEGFVAGLFGVGRNNLVNICDQFFQAVRKVAVVFGDEIHDPALSRRPPVSSPPRKALSRRYSRRRI